MVMVARGTLGGATAIGNDATRAMSCSCISSSWQQYRPESFSSVNRNCNLGRLVQHTRANSYAGREPGNNAELQALRDVFRMLSPGSEPTVVDTLVT
jgi:hypothetical protein